MSANINATNPNDVGVESDQVHSFNSLRPPPGPWAEVVGARLFLKLHCDGANRPIAVSP
jgi:hypothetical protein